MAAHCQKDRDALQRVVLPVASLRFDFFLPRLAFLILAGIVLPAARGQDERAPRLAPAPPQPRAVAVTTPRGGHVDIPLRIFGARLDRLTFLIRKAPDAGKLTEPQNDAPDSARVRYFPPEDRRMKQASFSYAVKSTDGVSAPVEVTVSIVDEPAMLSAPAERVFPRALLGERKSETLEIGNPGGETCAGEVSVEAPFAIEGGAAYEIEPKGKAFVQVAFAPTEPGAFETEVRFSSHPLTVTTLKGRANAALEIVPATLSLSFEPLTGVRSGFFNIRNHTAREQSIEVRTPERLEIAGPIVLPPGGEKVVPVATAPGDLAEIGETVEFAGTEADAVLAVKADAAPAVIRVAGKRLTLHVEPGGVTPGGELKLGNAGGMPAAVRLSGSEGLRLSEREFSLEPGEAKAVSVFLAKSPRADFRGAISVNAGARSQTVEVLAAAPVESGRRARSSGRDRGDRPRERDPVSRDEIAAAGNVPPGVHTRLIECGPDFATIEWPAAESAGGYRAELRQIATRNGRLETSWSAHPEFEATVADGRVRGTFRALRPGQVYSVRVRGGADSGTIVAAQTLITASPRVLRIFTWPRALGLLAAGLLGFIAWQRWQQRGTGF